MATLIAMGAWTKDLSHENWKIVKDPIITWDDFVVVLSTEYVNDYGQTVFWMNFVNSEYTYPFVLLDDDGLPYFVCMSRFDMNKSGNDAFDFLEEMGELYGATELRYYEKGGWVIL